MIRGNRERLCLEGRRISLDRSYCGFRSRRRLAGLIQLQTKRPRSGYTVCLYSISAMPRHRKSLQPPLSSQELRQIYLQNPTPEHARTLWEVARLKAVIGRFSEDYIKLMAMWPRGGEERPLLLEILKSDMLTEVREAWPRPRQQERPLDFRKDDAFADLDDEHPEDRALMAEWVKTHGKPP